MVLVPYKSSISQLNSWCDVFFVSNKYEVCREQCACCWLQLRCTFGMCCSSAEIQARPNARVRAAQVLMYRYYSMRLVLIVHGSCAVWRVTPFFVLYFYLWLGGGGGISLCVTCFSFFAFFFSFSFAPFRALGGRSVAIQVQYDDTYDTAKRKR